MTQEFFLGDYIIMKRQIISAGIVLIITACMWISMTTFAADVDIKAECEGKGYEYCESGAQALVKVNEYLDDVCWDDGTGIYVVYSGNDVSGSVRVNNNHSIADSYADFIFDVQVSNEKITLQGAGYNLLNVKRCAYETHSYGLTREQALEADAVADEIVNKCNAESTLDKISYIYNYLCENVVYDSAYEFGSIYDALVGGKTVCSGYAAAFQVMMEKLGIPCKIMAGNVNGTAHAWNAVNVSGKWYYVDATFANTMGMRADYLLFGSDRRADVYGIGVVGGDYDSSDETVGEEATGNIDDNGNESDKNRLWYVAVIAAGVLAAGAVAGWGVLRKRNKM